MERLFADTQINKTELYNPARYLRDVPLSVLPSSDKINNGNDVEHVRSANEDTNSSSDDYFEENQKTSNNSGNPVEFFISSDGSAILEHTNRVIYLEDDDVASISNNGHLSIHRIRHPDKDLPPLDGKSEIRDFASSIKKQEEGKLTSFNQQLKRLCSVTIHLLCKKKYLSRPNRLLTL